MPSRHKQEHACDDCGTTVLKRNRADRAMLCHSCAITRMSRAAIEMAEKSGPTWDAWLASNGPSGKSAPGDDQVKG